MQSLLDRLDIARRLISIDVKIIETTIDDKSQLGFSWPTSVGATLGDGVSGGDESDAETGMGNLTGTYDPNNGNWNWGTLSVDQARLFLDFLKQNGNSQLLSDPHVTVIENHPAIIKAETIIPIPTVNRFSEGGATQDIMTFQDEEIGISLHVTPRINEGNRITLDVFPQVEHITGFSGPSDNQKPITASRSIKTTIIVNDGETVALGGMLEETEIIRTQKVPLLGSIPIIGKLLFTHNSKEMSTTDLIILITPRIIQ